MNQHRDIVRLAPRTALLILLLAVPALPARAYPPAVGILGPSPNCLSCHASNGPWKDDETLIIDVLDKASGKSLRLADGSFVIEARRGEATTVLTVIGTAKAAALPVPYRNAWLYLDSKQVGEPSSLSKFAPGWDVNLPMACRLVGDPSPAYPEAHVTVLPMTVRAGEDVLDAEVHLQVMLTRGESVKGKAKEGMVGSYFERSVRLKVLEDKEGSR